MGLNFKELHHISLKWKLLIPFLFLPSILTLLLVTWGIASQSNLLRDQEEGRMRRNLDSFNQRLELRLRLAEALVELVALNPDTQEALAAHDRESLIKLYAPLYERLKQLPGISQFHFHTEDTHSLLRLHKLDMYSDELKSYRKTIVKAVTTGSVTGGLELGATGFGLRGVAPVYYDGRLVGSVEIGSNLNQQFLMTLKTDFDCDLTIYIPDRNDPEGFEALASTDPNRTFLFPKFLSMIMETGRTEYVTVEDGPDSVALLAGRLLDFEGRPAAVVELSRNRAETILEIRKYSFLILAFGLTILALALLFVWWVSEKFLIPIDVLVDQAEKITAGERVPQVTLAARDEFGTLATAINKMLDRLEDSRRELARHAQTLEDRVEARTAELVRSEEKYRLLVENIPLVVYRLEPNLIRTFVSPHLEKLTGWPPEEMVGGPDVWLRSIHPEDREKVLAAKKKALEKARTFEMEYRFQDRHGRVVEILDHAEPIRSPGGRILFLEGYMLDIRDRKLLQEQILRSEELKTLSEISARLAHEFRNPLSVAGLSARRLEKTIPKDDPCRPYTGIIIEEIGRLENILNMIQGFIRPMSMNPVKYEAKALLMDVIRSAGPFLKEHEITLDPEIDEKLPVLYIDVQLMNRALLNLIRNAAYQMPPKGVLRFIAVNKIQSLEIRLVYPAGYLQDDQLRHFFYPFTTEDADTTLLDLSLVPVIVQKHSGIINVGRDDEDLVAVTISLPAV